MARWCWNGPCSSPFAGSNPAATAGDRPEIAADQGAIDIGDGKQLVRIRRLDRSAVEDTHVTCCGKALAKPLADMRVHLGDVGDRRRPAGADRPDRLVGD